MQVVRRAKSSFILLAVNIDESSSGEIFLFIAVRISGSACCMGISRYGRTCLPEATLSREASRGSVGMKIEKTYPYVFGKRTLQLIYQRDEGIFPI